MKLKQFGQRRIILITGIVFLSATCQKTGNIPKTPNALSLTVVNAVPESVPIIPVINTIGPISYFSFAASIQYGGFQEYSPIGGIDTVYVVQDNSDTLNINSKSGRLLFYNVLDLKPGSIYSLFLTGTDTSSPDYLLTNDTIPYYASSDSAMGIRFANLSAGSAPISINLEGLNNGSEVNSLSYKSITGFKTYLCNSSSNGYLFVIRDAMTGDSLTQLPLAQGAYGLLDPNSNVPLNFKSVTVAVFGSESNSSIFPIQAILIEDY